MHTLSTSQVAHLLDMSAATVKRLSLAGRIACLRSPNGVRSFGLQAIADFHAGAPVASLEQALSRGSADACVLAVVRKLLGGERLPEIFDELLAALEQVPAANLDFIERLAPLAQAAAVTRSTALVLCPARQCARARLVCVLLRGAGYEVPAPSSASADELARLVACTDPAMVVVVEPPGARASAPPPRRADLAAFASPVLLDGRGNDFTTMREFFSRACIQTAAHRVDSGPTKFP